MERSYGKGKMLAALLALVLVAVLVPGAPALGLMVSGASATAVQLGSAGVAFERGGNYGVEVALMKATNIAEPSAAAGAIAPEATLEVAQDGTASLTVTVQKAEVMGLVGYASDFKIYQGASTSSETVDVEVLATAEVVANDGATKAVPTSIRFAIPAAMAGQDGVYLSMYVDLMGYSPDAYLAIDYESEPVQRSGSAHVEQFGQYDVNALVTTVAGRITAVELSGANFDASFASTNKAYLNRAIPGMRDNLIGKRAADLAVKDGVDTVSGATYSSKAILGAVRDALGVALEEKVIEVPSTLPEPGAYMVTISNTAHQASHSLVENETAPAILTVSKDGSATLSYTMVSGSVKEPLYILAVNGYYPNNDTSAAFTSEGLTCTTAEVDGLQVVTDVTMPLTGALSSEYFNNVTMYVPAMSNLEGEVSGIYFHGGVFSVDTTVTVDWGTLAPMSRPVSGLSVTGVSSRTYSGAANAPAPVVKDDSSKLVKGVDYELAYLNAKGKSISAKNVKAAGSYRVVVTGNGSYAGSVSFPFKVNKAAITSAKFGKVNAQRYRNGKAVTPSVTVKFNGAKLKLGTDYKLTYKNNKAKGANAQVIVKGAGNFKGTKKLTFAIR